VAEIRTPPLHVAAPPSAVWGVLAEFRRWGEWAPRFPLMRGEAREGARLVLHTRLPKLPPTTLPARVVDAVPGRSLSWAGSVPGLFRAHHGFDLAPDGAGTRVEHWERLEGPLGVLLVRLLGDDITEAYTELNLALARRVEQG
jgi:hypothetical protein